MKKLTLTIAAAAMATSAFAQTSLVNANFSQITDVGDGSFNLTGDLTLPANGEFILEGPLFVQNDATLTIQEGVIVRGQPDVGGEPGLLVITRDGKINASGTQSNPIIFTTAADDSNGRWTSGDTFLDAAPKTSPIAVAANLWGALVVLGNAPCNVGTVDTGSPGEAYIEGITEDARSLYGGFDANDNSGVLEYISIRYSGDVIVDGQEIQGLTLGGVGFGTKVQFVEVFGSGDDGIEIFGGTVGVKNLVLFGHDDDGFDGDHGWNGFAQNVLIVNGNTITADHAIELDGDDTDDFDGTPGNGDEDNISADGRPFASAHLANFTVIGMLGSDDTATRFRRGFGGSFKNSLIAGFPSTKGLRVDNTGGVLFAGTDLPVLFGYPSVKSQNRVTAGTFNIAGLTFFNVGSGTAATIANSAFEEGIINNTEGESEANIASADPGFGQVGTGFFAVDQGGIDLSDLTGGTFNPVPNPDSSAAWGSTVDLGSNFFDAQSYRGAFQPNASLELWTTGWTALNTAGIIVDRL
ncbi:MAG: hypothetical protein ACPGGN_00850 [Opitutales bacterium]